ncbi:DNA-3-methyladenine glycosylase I [Oceanomicrobium pacificus]|uniref:3-methyladenine DNA glycosylase n=1 Tax=Oceanomicrobium pacificus TaxID=2692916 RepID=A0A6B0TSG8_9RHOB|nr:DNA-3-methyladenine glycosylase I [Oceanomicrobium pacificus]MXU63953.1 3-methyladenine DNA glycosylase [Oceanomicrobium pacificus]
MQSFATIRARAEDRKGGAGALEDLLAAHPGHGPGSDAAIATLGDDRILSEFSRKVFQAGFNWSVVDKKWPGFETAFHGFDPARCAMMSDEDLDRHLSDTEIIRNAAKILSIRDNAVFFTDLAKEHGSAAKFLADWPGDDLVGLWDVLKKRGSRLGGLTGQLALRWIGKDSFVLGGDVVEALRRAGVVDGPTGSKRAQAAIQAAFNDWKAESGESYTRMSRILAYSV